MERGTERYVWRVSALVALAAGMAGCVASGPQGRVGLPGPAAVPPALPGLTPPVVFDALEAGVDPPVGWRRDKFDVDAGHTHAVWLSPTGQTAYGVVLINLPLPVGPEMVLWGFLNHMRQADRQGSLLFKHMAPELPGLRFIAESGNYRIFANLTVHNWRAWVIYVGTLKAKPLNQRELHLAEQARDHPWIKE
jgi:hypothetical protein